MSVLVFSSTFNKMFKLLNATWERCTIPAKPKSLVLLICKTYFARIHVLKLLSSCSNPQDSESQALSKAVMESQARKTTLSLAGAVVHRSAALLALARERAEEVTATDVLGSACLVTTLLPLTLAHISPLATSDPRV